MPKFFKQNFSSSPFIEGDDAAHITRSLRMRVGEKLVVCDTAGNDYFCEITDLSPDRIGLEIISTEKNDSEPNLKVTLFQCLPKGDKMDSVVKQSVEMGVSEVVPVISSRCVSLPDSKSSAKKVARWQKIAIEAAGQSGRGILPTVSNVISFKEMLSKLSEFDSVLFFYELGGRSLSSLNIKGGSCAVIIGSEGGFSTEECQMAEKQGATLCTLGKRILRTETAPIAALSAIMLLSGNMD